MKKFLRALTFILALLLAITLPAALTGCDTDTPAPSETSDGTASEAPSETSAETPTETPTEALTEAPDETAAQEPTLGEPEAPAEPQADLRIIEDGATAYSIVYPDGASAYTVNTASSLRSTLVQTFRLKASSFRARSDRSAPDTADGDGQEILVGLTNRAESQAVAATLPPDSFTVTSMGSKLVLLGTDDEHTALAVEYFLQHFANQAKGDLIFSHNSTVTEVNPMKGIELAEGANIRIMSWNLQCPDAEARDLFAHMMNGIRYYGADLIGLQECNAAAHKGVLEHLTQSYAIATVRHEGTSTYDYTPILYRPARFDLLDAGVEWLDGRYTGTNTKCLSWAVFSDKENGGAKLILVNFHGAVASSKYAGMENMTQAELNKLATEWKIDNVHQIHCRIRALEVKWGADVPVFVTGDYNTSKGAEPYKVMESYGYLDAEWNAVTSAMTGTKSTHTMGQMPAAGQPIDHVFYSPDRGITPYVHAFGTRRSDLDATDHLPLFVDFAIAP